MKYKVRKEGSINYLSKPIDRLKADKLKASLDLSYGDDNFEVVPCSVKPKKYAEPKENRLISDDEREAIKLLSKISYLPNCDHGEFANTMLALLDDPNPVILEKEADYLWYIIFLYKRQISEQRLIELARVNKCG